MKTSVTLIVSLFVAVGWVYAPSSVGMKVAYTEMEAICGSQCYTSASQTFEICDAEVCGERAIGSKAPTSTGFAVVNKAVCCNDGVGDCTCTENVDVKDEDGCGS